MENLPLWTHQTKWVCVTSHLLQCIKGDVKSHFVIFLFQTVRTYCGNTLNTGLSFNPNRYYLQAIAQSNDSHLTFRQIKQITASVVIFFAFIRSPGWRWTGGSTRQPYCHNLAKQRERPQINNPLSERVISKTSAVEQTHPVNSSHHYNMTYDRGQLTYQNKDSL